jgi:hypothetical protein
MNQIISGRVPPHQSAFYRQILNGNHRTKVIKQTVVEVAHKNPKQD